MNSWVELNQRQKEKLNKVFEEITNAHDLFEYMKMYYHDYYKWYIREGTKIYDDNVPPSKSSSQLYKKAAVKESCEDDVKKCVLSEMKKYYNSNASRLRSKRSGNSLLTDNLGAFIGKMDDYYEILAIYGENLREFQLTVNE